MQVERRARRRAVVNIAELFVRRPVMTVLVMIGILIFGFIAYRLLPVNALPNVDFPTIQVHGAAARREPGHDGLRGRDAAREAVLDDRRHRLDDLDLDRADSTTITLQFSLDRNIDAAAQDVQSAIAAARALAALDDADAADAAQGQPGRLRRSCNIALTSDDAAAVDGRRVRREPARAAHLDDQRRRAGAGLRLAEIRGAHPARSRMRWPRAASRSPTSSRRSATANVNLPTGTLYGARRGDFGAGDRPADERRGVRAADRRLPQRRAGAADRDRPRDRQRAERQDRGLVQRHARRSCSPSSASRAPTRSRSSTRSSEMLPTFQAQLPPAIKLDVLLRPLAVDPRIGARRAVHAAARAGPGGRRDLRVPAQRLGDADPEPRAADVDHRHVRGDVRRSATASTTCR